MLEITGHMDILLLGFALVFSLANFYIKVAVWFVHIHIGVGIFEQIKIIGGTVLPFVFLIHSVITKHELYLVPILVVAAVHFYAYFKTRNPLANKVVSN